MASAGQAGERPRAPPPASKPLPVTQPLLELLQDRHRAGVDAGLNRHPQGHVVAEQDQVEQLGQVAVALGPDLDDVGDHLAEQLGHQLEAPADLRDARRRGAGRRP